MCVQNVGTKLFTPKYEKLWVPWTYEQSGNHTSLCNMPLESALNQFGRLQGQGHITKPIIELAHIW